MDFLKDVFGAGALTYEQFTKAVGDKGIKLADLSQGGYVTKQKYDDELKAKGEQIEALNGNIKARDGDIAKLKKQLEAAGGDADKIKELTASLAELQGKYDTETKAFADKMSKQAYGFAVREFAGTQKFTSEAAKREFIRSLEEKEFRAQEFATECDRRGLNYHVSVGGLDSITLLLFLRSIGIYCPAISASYLEDKSIQAIHKMLGVETVKPLTDDTGKPFKNT